MDLSGFLKLGVELKFTEILSAAFVQKIFQVVRSNRLPTGLNAELRSTGPYDALPLYRLYSENISP